jgi:periplasmic protein TonB
MRRFALISLGLHAALLVGLVAWFRHRPPVQDAPDTQGTVELVMLEQKGTGATTASRQPPPAAPAPPEAPAPSPPVSASAPDADEALPLPQPAPPAAPSKPPVQPSAPRQPASAPPVQHAAEVPIINLGGTDSETNAIASGDHVVPASVDAKFHNKEPIYPLEAARRAEQGTVILLIHVAPNGLANGVDVEQSSGFETLDQAARDAVEGWHFLPAVKDGQPMPFDMQLRVMFHLD